MQNKYSRMNTTVLTNLIFKGGLNTKDAKLAASVMEKRFPKK